MSINRSPIKTSLIPSRNKSYQQQKEEELKKLEEEENDYRNFHDSFHAHRVEKPKYRTKDYAMRMVKSKLRKNEFLGL